MSIWLCLYCKGVLFVFDLISFHREVGVAFTINKKHMPKKLDDLFKFIQLIVGNKEVWVQLCDYKAPCLLSSVHRCGYIFEATKHNEVAEFLIVGLSISTGMPPLLWTFRFPWLFKTLLGFCSRTVTNKILVWRGVCFSPYYQACCQIY